MARQHGGGALEERLRSALKTLFSHRFERYVARDAKHFLAGSHVISPSFSCDSLRLTMRFPGSRVIPHGLLCLKTPFLVKSGLVNDLRPPGFTKNDFVCQFRPRPHIFDLFGGSGWLGSLVYQRPSLIKNGVFSQISSTHIVDQSRKVCRA